MSKFGPYRSGRSSSYRENSGFKLGAVIALVVVIFALFFICFKPEYYDAKVIDKYTGMSDGVLYHYLLVENDWGRNEEKEVMTHTFANANKGDTIQFTRFTFRFGVESNLKNPIPRKEKLKLEN